MLKVLICDDELNICRLIVRLIQWEQLGLSLVGTAQNGKEALAMITEHVPDIVLTDIRMPVFNGIELASKAQQMGLDTRFIVISGYDNFSYAQDALKASVADYLLKPINAQELNAALHKVCIQLKESRREKQQQSHMEDQLENMRSLEREIYIKNILLGNSEAYSASMLDACGLQFAEDNFASFAIIFDSASGEGSAFLAQHLDKFMRMISHEEYSCMRELLLCREGNIVFGVFNYGKKFSSVVRSYLDDIYYAGRRLCAVVPELHVTMAIGRTVEAPGQLSASIQSARDALHCRVNVGTDHILTYVDLPGEFKKQPRLDTNTISRLSSCLELCDCGALEHLLKTLFRDNSAGIHVSYYNLANELLSMMHKELTSIRSSDGYSAETPAPYENACASLERAYTADQIRRILMDYCTVMFSLTDRRGALQSDQAVELAKNYIEEHYADKCSLQEIANYSHLSANYLSSIFKKKVGISMNAYLSIKRINSAKTLLKETDEGIFEIGEKVGYHDPKHFRKVFKDNVGISPAKYRNLYR